MRGINYLFVVTPDKQTIYTDQLPSFFRFHRPGFTRREQLVNRLRDEPSFLDLTDALRAAKASGELYCRRDTHWNHHGAYEAYRVVMSYLGLPSLSDDLGQSKITVDHIGDLGRMIALELVESDERPQATCPTPAGAEEIALLSGLHGDDPVYRAPPPTLCQGANGRLLFFHDSFGAFWVPYLSSQFGFAGFAWYEPSFEELKSIVEALRPTTVIEQRAERLLRIPIRGNCRCYADAP